MTLSFAEEMQELAVELTTEFSEDIGDSTLHILTGKTRDTETGIHVKTWSTEVAPMVYSDISEKEVADGSYRIAHMKCTVAGNNLLSEPKQDYLIEMPDGTVHRIVDVKWDQYKAAYTMFVERKNV